MVVAILLAAGGNARGVSLGVRGGGCDEGDGEGGAKGIIGLVIRSLTYKNK